MAGRIRTIRDFWRALRFERKNALPWACVALGVVVLAALGAALLNLHSASATLRYRLTIAATADGKPVTASTVQEVRFRGKASPTGLDGAIPSGPYISANVSGEALALPINRQETLYALMMCRKDNCAYEWLLPYAFGLLPQKGMAEDAYVRSIASLSGSRKLSGDLIPVLVRFRDEGDPATLEPVDPQDPAASFGHAMTITGVEIAVVDDDLKRTIEKRLPWLRQLSGGFGIPVPPVGGVYRNERIVERDFRRE